MEESQPAAAEELPELPLSPMPVDSVQVEVVLVTAEGIRAPPPSPVEVISPLQDVVLPQLEAVAAALEARGTGSRRSTRSQPGELVAGLESDRRPTRKSSVSSCLIDERIANLRLNSVANLIFDLGIFYACRRKNEY